MLTISVKNFGPIAEGSVDLKPLTIFVGPSNTGKSYMATAVYAVMRAAGPFASAGFADSPDNIIGGLPRRSPLSFEQFVSRSEGFKEIQEPLREWFRHHQQAELPWVQLTVADLPPRVREWLEKTTLWDMESFHRETVVQLHQIHGEEYGVVSRGIEADDFYLTINRDYPALNLRIQLSDTLQSFPDFNIAGTVLPIHQAPSMPSFFWSVEYESGVRDVANKYADLTTANAFTGFTSQSYYLPAARSGIAQGHKVLAAALVRQSSLIGIRQLNIPTLPGITTEFLSHLISFDRRIGGRRRVSKLDNAISFIENDVLRGKIDLDESGGLPYPEIVYLEDGSGASTEKFTLEHTSSMVSELAPLILFLKYLIDEGDLLILEEPESHLHPAAQRRLARGIVRLVNAGVKVLITTHSDIIISQVNNLLALRQASPELVEQGGFEPDDFLQPEQVGAYLFRYNPELSGCETVPLEIDPDTGIDEDEFAAVFEAIYDESIALQRDRN